MKKRYSKAVKFLSVVLTICLSLCVALPQGAVFAEEADYVTSAKAEIEAQTENYQLAAENKNLALYVDMKSGYFAVLNKNNGSVWYSVPTDVNEDSISKGVAKQNNRSHLVLEYIAVEDIFTGNGSRDANSASGCVAKGGLKVTKIKDGVQLMFNFVDLEFKIPVTYVIKDDHLEASVDLKNFDEGTKNQLITLQFLPCMGAANQQENGYLFVPDGCGAVAGFNKGIISSGYSKMVYSGDRAEVAEQNVTQQEDIRFPVFGTVVEGKGAMFGIITSGDGASTIYARTASTRQNYNVISSRLRYRIYRVGTSLYTNAGTGDRISTVTQAPFGVDSYTLRYYFLSGEDANYSGMANCYRDYLTKEKGLKKSVDKSTLALNVYGSLETTANFLGIKYNKKRVLTSFEDAQNIVEELKESGVDNISLLYTGWTNNGVINRKYLKSAAPLSVLGGKKDLDTLLQYLKDNDFEYYLGADFLNYTTSGGGVSRKNDSSIAPNGDLAVQFDYSIVTYEYDPEIKPWVLISPLELKSASSKFIKNFNKRGYDSIFLANIGSMVYSDFSPKDGIYRSTSITLFENFVKDIEVENVAVDGGNSYVVPYADRIYNLSISSSKYDLFDYDVPFMQMVLHGYKNYTTPAVVQSVDPKTTYLKSLETGSDLQFLCISDDSYNLRETRLSSMYSSEFSLWKDTAVEYYKAQKQVNNPVFDQTIVKHECLAANVFKTVYSNGTTVYVNYSDQDVTVEDVTVKAENYALKEAA